MGILSKLTETLATDEPERLRHWQPIPHDENGTKRAPQEVTATTDVRKVVVKYDNGTTFTVRRVIDGSWQCLSCHSCNHARMARELIEEWARMNTRE